MTELTTLINWFGTVAGVLGVCIAVYLQLINPRKVEPGYVVAIFTAGAAVILVFSPAWATDQTIPWLKLGAATLFVISEFTAGYYVWKNGEIATARETIASLFKNGNGGPA